MPGNHGETEGEVVGCLRKFENLTRARATTFTTTFFNQKILLCVVCCVRTCVGVEQQGLINVVFPQGYDRHPCVNRCVDQCVTASGPELTQEAPYPRLRPFPLVRHEPQRMRELSALQFHLDRTDTPTVRPEGRLLDHPYPRLTLGERLGRKALVLEETPGYGIDAARPHPAPQ